MDINSDLLFSLVWVLAKCLISILVHTQKSWETTPLRSLILSPYHPLLNSSKLPHSLTLAVARG